VIQLLERGLLEGLGYGGACVVHEHIQLAESGDGFFDSGVDGFRVGRVRLDGEGFSTDGFDCFDYGGGCVGVL